MFQTIRTKISEMAVDATRWPGTILSAWGPFSFSGLRSRFRVIASKYWGNQPAYENTLINYDLARQLYRNDGNVNLGSGFCRPIVDLQVDFIGLPTASVESEIVDDQLNTCLHDYWADSIAQMYRDAIRDSKVIVRIKQPSLDNPLMTAEEAQHCILECIVPERVIINRDPLNQDVILSATVTHKVLMVEEEADIVNGVLPKEKEHDIIELITPQDYTYYDKTENAYLDSWASDNTWGFVPLLEVWNEFSTELNGGQSDLESVFPFISAFHDVFTQSLQAHKYHSTPKVKFKIKDIGQFLKNNFPDAFDSVTGKIKPQAEISWTGKEMIFIEADEDAEFLEAESVLGDSKTLLDFIFECICVASQTPPWAFMKVASAANQPENAQTVPFTRKIMRKRVGFQKYIQELLKMYLVIIDLTPLRASITWASVQPQDDVMRMTAFQQLVMALEVAAQRQIVSDDTYRAEIRPFVRSMKNPAEEEKDAQDNFTEQLPVSSNGHGSPQNVPVVSGQQGKNE